MATYDDPRILRAVAHPTRNRILSELFAGGSLRAVDIARLLGIPANQASFHLRQLAKHGLVEEAPEEARDGRDRVWRMSDPDGVSFRTAEMLSQPGGAAAYAVFQRSKVAWGHHLVDRALAVEVERPEVQIEKSVSEWTLRLTPEEAHDLSVEMGEVVGRWRDKTQRAEGERVTYSVFQLVQPLPDRPEETP